MINPGKPAYFETAYSADDVRNGVPLPPVTGGKPAPALPHAPPGPAPESDPDAAVLDFRKAMRGAGEAPPPRAAESPVSPETTDALINAVRKVHSVVNARIRYHEAEAARLKASLAPFATMAGAPASNSEGVIKQLLDIVKGLPDPPETTP